MKAGTEINNSIEKQEPKLNELSTNITFLHFWDFNF